MYSNIGNYYALCSYEYLIHKDFLFTKEIILKT